MLQNYFQQSTETNEQAMSKHEGDFCGMGDM